MTIKVQHPSRGVFQRYLECALNTACVIAGHGNIPTPEEQANPDQYGRYWWREGSRYNLWSVTNDWWANVQSETETSMELSFSYRYDQNGVADALCVLLQKRFPDFVTIVA